VYINVNIHFVATKINTEIYYYRAKKIPVCVDWLDAVSDDSSNWRWCSNCCVYSKQKEVWNNEMDAILYI